MLPGEIVTFGGLLMNMILERSVVANYVRTKLSFELVRSQVACIRGSRQLRKMNIDSGEMELVSNNAVITERS